MHVIMMMMMMALKIVMITVPKYTILFKRMKMVSIKS